MDHDGNRYEITSPITLSFGLDGSYQHPMVYYISKNGEAQKMDTSVKGGRISFTTAQDFSEKSNRRKNEEQP